MKGKIYPSIIWEVPFEWKIERDESLESYDEPSKKAYQCYITHPDLPNWGFRDSLTHTSGKYGHNHNSGRFGKQKDIALNLTLHLALESFHKCWENRHGEGYRS